MELDSLDFSIQSITDEINRPLDLTPFYSRKSSVNLREVFDIPKFDDFLDNYNNESNQLVDRLYFYSTKGGPNGAPAFMKFQADYAALVDDPNVWWRIFDYFSKVNRGEVATPIVDPRNFNLTKAPTRSKTEQMCAPRHSKLTFLQDKAGKTRVVASLDHVSQSVLEPLHIYLTAALGKISSDFTSDQGKGRRLIQDVSKSGCIMYSFDLKSATDRLPRELAIRVLSDFIGLEGAFA